MAVDRQQALGGGRIHFGHTAFAMSFRYPATGVESAARCAGMELVREVSAKDSH